MHAGMYSVGQEARVHRGFESLLQDGIENSDPKLIEIETASQNQEARAWRPRPKRPMKDQQNAIIIKTNESNSTKQMQKSSQTYAQIGWNILRKQYMSSRIELWGALRALSSPRQPPTPN